MRKFGGWAALLLAAAAFTSALRAQAQVVEAPAGGRERNDGNAPPGGRERNDGNAPAGGHGQWTGFARQAALTRQIEALLRAGVEATDVEPTLVALGDAGEQAVRALFERADAPAYVRLRALAALQGFETDATARYFEALVRAAETPAGAAGASALERSLADRLGELHPARSPLVLRRALQGLLALEARVQLRLDAAAITACLNHADAHVRRAAADLSAALDDRPGGQEIAQALRTQLARERSTMVRGHLEKALTSRLVRPAAPR